MHRLSSPIFPRSCKAGRSLEAKWHLRCLGISRLWFSSSTRSCQHHEVTKKWGFGCVVWVHPTHFGINKQKCKHYPKLFMIWTVTWHLPLEHLFLSQEVSLSPSATSTEEFASLICINVPNKVNVVMLTCQNEEGPPEVLRTGSDSILAQEISTEIKITRVRRWIEKSKENIMHFPFKGLIPQPLNQYQNFHCI